MQTNTDEFFTRKQTMALFHVSMSTLQRLEKSGKLTAIKPGGTRKALYARENVLALTATA